MRYHSLVPNPISKPIIGLAGGIGSGKSAVAGILAKLGCVVAYSDRENAVALTDPEIRDSLIRWWGLDILDSSGEIDRQAVARIIFANPGARKRLEALTHPWIKARHQALFETAGPEVPALVVDAPLLFEAGWETFCDVVIFVEAPPQSRLQRVLDNRGWDEAELTKREVSQLPLDEKRIRADYIVCNDGDLSDLETQTRRVLSEIVEFRST